MVESFTKSDLKSGMVLEHRDGRLSMVLMNTNNGDIISGGSWCPISAFRNDLTYEDCKFADIMKIYQPNSNKEYLSSGISINGCSLIWERKETIEMTLTEIVEKLGYKIKIIG